MHTKEHTIQQCARVPPFRGSNHNRLCSLHLRSHKRGHSISTAMAQWEIKQKQKYNAKNDLQLMRHNAKQWLELTVTYCCCTNLWKGSWWHCRCFHQFKKMIPSPLLWYSSIALISSSHSKCPYFLNLRKLGELGVLWCMCDPSKMAHSLRK